jgi:DNA-binding CsgD family transcriptional regulator
MAQPINTGLPPAPWAAGDHICALYSGPEEREATLAPFLAAGLDAGQKCVCILEAADHAGLLEEVRADAEVDVDRCIASGQLEMFTAAESYVQAGMFSADEMLEFWTDSLHDALYREGFESVRSAGDTTGITDLVDDFDEFAVYEAHLNRLTAEYPQTILCLYDVRLFGGAVVLELLRTHRKLLLGGLMIENPHYLTPDEYLTLKRHSIRGWSALSESQQRVAELVVDGLSNNDIADRLSLSLVAVDQHLHRVFRKLDVTSRGELVRFVTERRRPR